jgi:hypothetical protein
MIIKRWDGSAWQEEHPKTKAQLIFNNGNTESIFDSNDTIRLNYLPDAVFDSLYFYGTVSSAPNNLYALADVAVTNAASISRSPLGYYWVSQSAGITANPTTAVLHNGKYWKTILNPSDEGTTGTGVTNSTLEAGDWIVITKIAGGDGSTSALAIEVTFGSIENTYELATTAADGIVRLSDATTYASLSGNHAITEGVLKTVIDQASFALSSHTHGNITNDGKVTTNTAAASGQHLVITSSTDVVEQSAITLGSTTTTFLSNAGTWLTPAGTYVHPTLTAFSIDTAGVEVLDVFASNTNGHVTNITKRTLPNASTSAAGVMSASDKIKLDGIATGANLYVHPSVTLTQTAGTETTLTDITLIDSLSTTSEGHLSGATWRKLVAGTNVSISAAIDGNITISSTDTNTTYSALASGGLTLTGTQFGMVHPLYMQADAPTSPLSGTIWFDL